VYLESDAWEEVRELLIVVSGCEYPFLGYDDYKRLLTLPCSAHYYNVDFLLDEVSDVQYDID
jgi:hypothetical protein